jgi:hypothetical protein
MLHLWLIILLVEDDVHIDSEAILMNDFINLNIKSTQSFEGDHRDMM